MTKIHVEVKMMKDAYGKDRTTKTVRTAQDIMLKS